MCARQDSNSGLRTSSHRPALASRVPQAIASKAVLQKPAELNVPHVTFKDFFHEEWTTVRAQATPRGHAIARC